MTDGKRRPSSATKSWSKVVIDSMDKADEQSLKSF